MFDYRLLKTLSYVIEHGSFELAAQNLYLSQSAVSQRLKQLEDQVGQLLIVRSNPVQPTPYGKKLIEHYLKVSLLESNILSDVDIENTRIPIAINADSLATWFIPAVKHLVNEHSIFFDVKVADQDITHRAFQQGEVIGCVSSRGKPFQGCNVTKLGEMKCIAVASQSFINKYLSQPMSKEKMLLAPTLIFNRDDTLITIYLEKFYGLKLTDIQYHSIPSTEAFISAAKHGMALSVLPEAQIIKELNSGEVINIDKNQFIMVPLYWHSWALETKIGKSIHCSIINGAKEYLR